MIPMTDEERSEWLAANWPLDMEATRHVAMWIANDFQPNTAARLMLNKTDDPSEALAKLAAYATRYLNTAKVQSGAWHTRREISDNAMERIDWIAVADALLTE